MKTIFALAVLMFAGAVDARADGRVQRQVDSLCDFKSSDGAVQARFLVQYLVFDEDRGREEIRVTSTLILDGRQLPAAYKSCMWRRAGGTFCAHANYELRPQIGSNDKVEKTALVRWAGVDLLGLGEGSCQ
jgi:hypothetical protein